MPLPNNFKGVMTEKKKRKLPKTFLSNDRIKEIKQEISEYEKMMKADDMSDVGYLPHIRNQIQDPRQIAKEIHKRKKLLHDFSPQKLTGAKANRAYAYAKKLTNYIKENRPTKREIKMPYPKGDDTSTDFEAAVQKQMAWQMGAGQRAEQALKHIFRRLDPEDPTISNLERFRR